MPEAASTCASTGRLHKQSKAGARQQWIVKIPNCNVPRDNGALSEHSCCAVRPASWWPCHLRHGRKARQRFRRLLRQLRPVLWQILSDDVNRIMCRGCSSHVGLWWLPGWRPRLLRVGGRLRARAGRLACRSVIRPLRVCCRPCGVRSGAPPCCGAVARHLLLIHAWLPRRLGRLGIRLLLRLLRGPRLLRSSISRSRCRSVRCRSVRCVVMLATLRTRLIVWLLSAAALMGACLTQSLVMHCQQRRRRADYCQRTARCLLGYKSALLHLQYRQRPCLLTCIEHCLRAEPKSQRGLEGFTSLKASRSCHLRRGRLHEPASARQPPAADAARLPRRPATLGCLRFPDRIAALPVVQGLTAGRAARHDVPAHSAPGPNISKKGMSNWGHAQALQTLRTCRPAQAAVARCCLTLLHEPAGRKASLRAPGGHDGWCWHVCPATTSRAVPASNKPPQCVLHEPSDGCSSDTVGVTTLCVPYCEGFTTVWMQ